MSVLKRVIGGGLEGLGRGMMADAQARGQAAREAYLRAHQTQLAQMEIDARAAEGRLGRQHEANMAAARYDFEGGQRQLDRDLQLDIEAGRITQAEAEREARAREAAANREHQASMAEAGYDFEGGQRQLDRDLQLDIEAGRITQAEAEREARAREAAANRQHDANMADARYDFEGGQRQLDRDLQREIAAGRMTEEQAQRAAAERAARGEDYRRRSGTVDELGVETTDQHRVDALNRGYEFYNRDPEKWEVDYYLNSSQDPENRRWPQQEVRTWEDIERGAQEVGVTPEELRDRFAGLGFQVPDAGTRQAGGQTEPQTEMPATGRSPDLAGGGGQVYEPAMDRLSAFVDERTAGVRGRRNTGEGGTDSPRPGGGSLIERLNQAIGDRPLTVVPQSAADNLSEGETGGTVQPATAPDTETTERVRQAVTPAGERLGRGTAGVGGRAGRQADPRGAREGALGRVAPAQETARPQVTEAVDRIAQQANPTWETIAQSIIEAGGNANDLMGTLRALRDRGITLPSGQMSDDLLGMLISATERQGTSR